MQKSNLDARSLPWLRFPARLVAARLAHGWTQIGLAKACGRTGNSWIAMLEGHHNRKSANLDDVRLLAETTGVPMEWLLFGQVFGRKFGPLAVGRGGPMVEVRDLPVCDLALHPGQWTNRAGDRGKELVLVDCLAPDPKLSDNPWVNAGWARFLIDSRGDAVVMEGRINAEGHLVDADGKVLCQRGLVGLCR